MTPRKLLHRFMNTFISFSIACIHRHRKLIVEAIVTRIRHNQINTLTGQAKVRP